MKFHKNWSQTSTSLCMPMQMVHIYGETRTSPPYDTAHVDNDSTAWSFHSVSAEPNSIGRIREKATLILKGKLCLLRIICHSESCFGFSA